MKPCVVIISWRFNFFARGVINWLPDNVDIAIIHTGKDTLTKQAWKSPRPLVDELWVNFDPHPAALEKLTRPNGYGQSLLAKTGADSLLLIDHDAIAESNLQQVYDRACRDMDLGDKALAAYACGWQMFKTFPWMGINPYHEAWSHEPSWEIPNWEAEPYRKQKSWKDTGQHLGIWLEARNALKLVPEGDELNIVIHPGSGWHYRWDDGIAGRSEHMIAHLTRSRRLTFDEDDFRTLAKHTPLGGSHIADLCGQALFFENALRELKEQEAAEQEQEQQEQAAKQEQQATRREKEAARRKQEANNEKETGKGNAL